MVGWCRFIGAAGAAALVVAVGAPVHADASGPPGHLVFVQAVPNESLDVSVDGRTVRRDSAVGAVLGPLSVSPGRHQVGFTDPSGTLRITSTVDVAAGSSSDIVVHLPAAVDGAPVVNAYETPRAAIAPGKARVLIAHTATVAPADVRVDGQVVFHNIANGEYATADVAAGGHTVALLPAGLDAPPILGPLHVDLQAGTVTMAYAYGNPRDHSMNVISHAATLSSNGAVVPASIDTGRAGLATRVVHPFRLPQAGLPQHLPTSGSDDGPWLTVGGGVLLAASGLLTLRLRRRASSRSG
jgi:LPXTG-motif cell wall-anchored protein